MSKRTVSIRVLIVLALGAVLLIAGLVYSQASSLPAQDMQRVSAGAEYQKHMVAALDHLRSARDQLSVATHDKGGHRVKALDLVNQAIAQVEKGINYDNTH